MSEIWKNIPGYEGIYWVSSHGRVKNKNGFMRLTKVKGYYSVKLSNDGYRHLFKIHRLVMQAFVGYSEMMVLHNNGNSEDNRLENLRYGTAKENMEDMSKHRKEKGLFSRFTIEERDKIGSLLLKGLSGKAIAKEMGVHQSTISRYLKNTRATKASYIPDYCI